MDPKISFPTNVSHELHVVFDAQTGEFKVRFILLLLRVENPIDPSMRCVHFWCKMSRK